MCNFIEDLLSKTQSKLASIFIEVIKLIACVVIYQVFIPPLIVFVIINVDARKFWLSYWDDY